MNCILHVCGGDPWVCPVPFMWILYSPRMWRWSWHVRLKVTVVLVFSTYVEVILKVAESDEKPTGILHVCGGDPTNSTEKAYVDTVFSTYVEVIPNQDYHRGQQWCILHVCGGDPNLVYDTINTDMYSPHMLRVLLSLSAQINSL